MSNRTIKSSLPNMISASARASSVLPTPVGPRKRKLPIDLLQHVPDDLVLDGRIQQMVRVEIEASPLHRRLSRAPQQRACGIAEELRDVDSLDRPRRRRDAFASRGVPEEVGEEIVEEAAAAEAVRQPLFGEVELAEV